jgi:hypothetical protein
MTNPRNVAILVFDDVEILDFAGPYEVFNVASDTVTQPRLLHSTYTTWALHTYRSSGGGSSLWRRGTQLQIARSLTSW